LTLTPLGYIPRVVDAQIAKHLQIFGAVSVEGPKWCGKTWTSTNHANSVFFVGDPSNNFSNRQLAQLNPEAALRGVSPHAIDEWQEVPGLWDAVRFTIDQASLTSSNDEDKATGRFILTGSSRPATNAVMHSGAGRISRIAMRPMTLLESNDSSGRVSIQNLIDRKPVEIEQSTLGLEKLIQLVIRGGWPNNLTVSDDNAGIIPKSYLDELVNQDMTKLDGIERSPGKTRSLLRSLARNNSTLVTNATLSADTAVYGDSDILVAESTVSEYLSALRRLYILEEIPAWTPEMRGKIRLRVSPKRYLVDPSLAVAALNADYASLEADLKTFGMLFEGLCLRDLTVYAQALNANLCHYLDSTGLDADAILELPGQNWAAIEIKLGVNQVDDAANKLNKLQAKITNAGNKPPLFKAVIVGIGAISQLREDGVYIIPIDHLGL
jgi:predicted AAA+ superfamily ATPase